MEPSASLRRRKKKQHEQSSQSSGAAAASTTSKSKKEEKSTTTPSTDDGKNATDDDDYDDSSLWSTFTSHPLIRVAPFVLIPYLFYRSYFYFYLVAPPSFLNLRPAVSVHDERQVLIVGTMSSGTVQVATDLFTHFRSGGLEILHEAADSSRYFCRDGTVSWFHGIRFLPRPVSEEMTLSSLVKFCVNGTTTSKMGFHPSMYRSTSDCSSRKRWDRCWAKECMELLYDEWGCGLSLSKKPCQTPFRTTLHQVRHPLRTVESLATKFCVGGINGTLHPSFAPFMGTFFPSLAVEEDNSCLQAAVKYVLEYTNAMIRAREDTASSSGSTSPPIAAWYPIETTTPCQIMELAGFTSPSTVIHNPHVQKIHDICQDPLSQARQVMTSTKHQINKGQLKLTWKDLKAGIHSNTDTTMGTELRNLCTSLGYDPDEERIVEEEELY